MLVIIFLSCIVVIGVQSRNCTYPGHGVHSWTSLDNLNVTSYLPGTNVTYFCDPGFAILANYTRFCMDNGRWTHDEPICAVNVAFGRNITDISRQNNPDSTESVHNLLDGYYGKCYPVQSSNHEDEVAWEIDLLEIHSIDAVRLVVKNNVTEFRFGVHVSVNESDWTEMQRMAQRSMHTEFVGLSVMTVFDVYSEFPVEARYVRIEKYPDSNTKFNLCELLIYSKTAISPQQCKSLATTNSSLVAVHEGTCFNFIREKDEHRDWLGAKEECELKSSYLATNIGQNRHNFLQLTLLNAHSSWQMSRPDHYWIAGKASKSGKGWGSQMWNWKWPNGKTIEDLFWAHDAIQPRILPGIAANKDECIAMAEELSWFWSNDACSNEQSYICQHKVRSCGTPEQKPNSVMRIVSTRMGVKLAVYNCSRGYFLEGPSIRRCMSSAGHWDGNAPTCTYVDCRAPVNIYGLNHQLLDNSTAYGSRVKYTCSDSSMSVVNGSQYWICQGNGMWLGEIPSCGVVVSSKYTNEEIGMWVLYVGIAIIVILLVFMGVLIYICVKKQSRRAEFTVKHTKDVEHTSSKDRLEANELYCEQGAANYGSAQTKQ